MLFTKVNQKEKFKIKSYKIWFQRSFFWLDPKYSGFWPTDQNTKWVWTQTYFGSDHFNLKPVERHNQEIQWRKFIGGSGKTPIIYIFSSGILTMMDKKSLLLEDSTRILHVKIFCLFSWSFAIIQGYKKRQRVSWWLTQCVGIERNILIHLSWNTFLPVNC